MSDKLKIFPIGESIYDWFANIFFKTDYLQSVNEESTRYHKDPFYYRNLKTKE